MAKKYRNGVQDNRERYSDRVQLLIESDNRDDEGYYFDRFFILEFDAVGHPVGKDELPSFTEAKHEFDALVEMIEYQDNVTIRPI